MHRIVVTISCRLPLLFPASPKPRFPKPHPCNVDPPPKIAAFFRNNSKTALQQWRNCNAIWRISAVQRMIFLCSPEFCLFMQNSFFALDLRALKKIAIANRHDFLSQTSLSPVKPQWDFIFLEKSQKESQSLATFHRKKKSQGFLGGEGHFWGQKVAAIFSPASENRNCNRRKIATLGALSSWQSAQLHASPTDSCLLFQWDICIDMPNETHATSFLLGFCPLRWA